MSPISYPRHITFLPLMPTPDRGHMLVITHLCDFNVQAPIFTLKEVLIGGFINDL